MVKLLQLFLIKSKIFECRIWQRLSLHTHRVVCARVQKIRGSLRGQEGGVRLKILHPSLHPHCSAMLKEVWPNDVKTNGSMNIHLDKLG